MLSFIQSLGIIGYIVLGIIILSVWNLKKLLFLRSPLDSQQHKLWRATGGTTRPDHLPENQNGKKN